MDSFEETRPMASYITKMLLLETVKCSQSANDNGLEWLQKTMWYLAIRWDELNRFD